jgi:small-conductance mechanosensitive channel
MTLIAAMRDLQPLFAWAPPWVFTLALMSLALAAALLAHFVIVRVVRRGLRHESSEFWRPLVVRTRAPGRLAFIIVAMSAAVSASPMTMRQTAFAQHVLGIAFIILMGWVGLIAVDLAAALFARRAKVDVSNNLLARKHLTQIRILQRAAAVLVIVVTVAMALMTIEQVRQWGVSLLAAGGAAGIFVGLALQPLLSNLIAGIQIAATQPIRLDDQVKIEDEVGRIEEINATYVVVRLWDERRLLLPLTYILQKPFQNWTRETANQTGAVMLYVDYTTPVEPLRAKLEEILQGTTLWDRRVHAVQVTDAKEKTMEIRCLVSASDPGSLFDLRCLVREGLIAYLRDAMPTALPRDRQEVLEAPWADGELSPRVARGEVPISRRSSPPG